METAATDDSNRSDYTSGDVRPHHEFYYGHGDIVLQVEQAIFKVHRNFLARHSKVLEDLFQVPQSQENADGTEKKPLLLNGDSVQGWESLFTSIYPSILLEPVQLSSAQLTALLRMAHKYCMQSIEDQIIAKLKAAHSTAGYVDLMVAAQITGSQALYQQALQGLRASDRKPDLEEAKKIGIEAYHELMQAPHTHWIPLGALPFALDDLGLRSLSAHALGTLCSPYGTNGVELYILPSTNDIVYLCCSPLKAKSAMTPL